MPVRSPRVHFIVGLFISLVFGFIYTPRAGFCLSVGISLLKEHEDIMRYHAFKWQNTILTWFGAFTGFLFTNIGSYF